MIQSTMSRPIGNRQSTSGQPWILSSSAQRRNSINQYSYPSLEGSNIKNIGRKWQGAHHFDCNSQFVLSAQKRKKAHILRHIASKRGCVGVCSFAPRIFGIKFFLLTSNSQFSICSIHLCICSSFKFVFVVRVWKLIGIYNIKQTTQKLQQG